MKILHIHQDYPDGLPYPSTKAVYNLIHACKDKNGKIDHYVLSINRTSNPFKVKAKKFKDGLAIVYWSIPLPYLYTFSLWLTANFLVKVLKKLNIDVIHGHKMTTEGSLAFFLAKQLSIPYCLSVRGGSDTNNLKRFSVHNDFFARVYNDAFAVFWVSPWAKKTVELCIGRQIEKANLLPNICIIDLNCKLPQVNNRSAYITAVTFHQYKRKGLISIIQAISTLNRIEKKIYLDIYGGGEDENIRIVAQEISRLNLEEQVRLRGEVSQEELRIKMSDSKGFILPSKNETFGMSYIEALSVGCPIVYMADTGVDGYFDSYNVGVKLESQDVSEIASALVNIEQSREVFVQGILTMHKNNYLDMFTGSKVAGYYLTTLCELIPKEHI